MNKFLSKLFDVAFHLIPMNRNIVFFSSFNGLYNDNPRYISEKLHSLYPKVKIVWVVAPRANQNDIPSYLTKVAVGTLKYFYYKNRAKILIDNYIGLLSKFVYKKSIINSYMVKKGQLNYSTWHGTPLKRIGRGFIEQSKGCYVTSSTCYVLNSSYIADIFRKDITNEVPIKLIGSPRNDLLFHNNQERCLEIKKKLSLPLDKKIVIYAPTYRSTNKNIDGDFYSVYIQPSDVQKCLQTLNHRFGGEWIFVYRVHQHVLNDINCVDNSFIINGNLHDDMAEYLYVSDVLITDYSGSLFDYTVTRKPCFLYAPDYETYKNEGRGTYLKIEELPYPIAFTIEELLEKIDSYNETRTYDQVELFNKKIGLIDDGNAANRIVELMNEEAHFVQ